MCFYCWKCSPSNPNDPKDGYYSMTICCFSKNILSAIIWLFSIRLIFDIIFTVIFAIFEIPFFIFLTLIVAVALILAFLGFKLKFAWIYYCFGFLTIILLILDLGGLSYIIYSLANGSGWLYDYAHKHISKKSDESLFKISERNYTATDLILFIFGIFLLLSFLHDLTNLLMINRSIQYLKRFSKNLNKIHGNSSNMNSRRQNGFRNEIVNGERYTKRPSDLSIPSIVAPHRLSYIEISEEPIRVTTIPHSQPQSPNTHYQQSERPPQALINEGYSFVETIPSRRTISNAAAVAASSPGYEAPLHSRINENEYASLEHGYEDNRIHKQDAQNPFSDPNKKDSKNEKTQVIHPNDAPPIPPKSVTQSTKSQNSESSSFIYKNTVYNDLESPQQIPPISPFIPIVFNPLNLERPSTESFQESNFSSSDSSFDNEQPTSSIRIEETNVTHENQLATNQYSNINSQLSQNQNFASTSNKHSSLIKITDTNITTVIQETSANQGEALYANILPYENTQNPPLKMTKTNISSSVSQNNQQIFTSNQSQQIYSNINLPPLPPPRQRRYESSSSDESFIEHLNPINNAIPAESAIDKGNDDTLSFTSNDSNDLVTFWSHHPSTRRRRASKDLLNKSGFLSDSSEEEKQNERVPKLLPQTTTTNRPPLKSYGLTQILKLDKKDTVLDTVESNENEKQERKEIRSDSLIFALESIKIMEEHEKEKRNITQSHDGTSKIEMEKNFGTNDIEQKEYSMNVEYQKNQTSSNYENILMKDENLPYQPFVKDNNAIHSDIMFKRESMSFHFDEIQKTEHYETPLTHFSKITNTKKAPTMTPETPIIPSTSNFFDAWGKAADRNSDKIPTNTIPFTTSNIEIDEKEEDVNILSNAKEESNDSDSSTMTFSSSSDDEDEETESDVDTRFKKLKQKLQNHFSDKKEVEGKTEVIHLVEDEASSSSNNITVTKIKTSSNYEEESQPIKFKRLPLIGGREINETPPSTEIFSTPPTTPIYQNSLTKPPLPKMPPPTVSHQIARRVSVSSSSSQSLKSINEN